MYAMLIAAGGGLALAIHSKHFSSRRMIRESITVYRRSFRDCLDQFHGSRVLQEVTVSLRQMR